MNHEVKKRVRELVAQVAEEIGVNILNGVVSSGSFHSNFGVRQGNKWSYARRTCAGIVNYFKRVQHSRWPLSVFAQPQKLDGMSH